VSKNELARILGYALVDEEFSVLLATSPDDAIKVAGSDLSDNERLALNEFSVSDFREVANFLNS
jgi:hypothetical protein